MKNLNRVYLTSEIKNFYSSNRKIWNHLYDSEKVVIKNLKIKKNSTVMDIGSACGGLGAILKKKYGLKKYLGIEINKQACELSSQLYNNFKFVNTDLLNFEKRSLKLTKFDYVFSLGCIDWNVELNKMLNKAWSHVKSNGHLILTLRLTNKKIKEKSYQYINFSKELKGEKAPYHVLSFKELEKKIKKLNVSKIISHGYWKKPNVTVITPYKKIFFVALALKKNFNNKNTLKNIF